MRSANALVHISQLPAPAVTVLMLFLGSIFFLAMLALFYMGLAFVLLRGDDSEPGSETPSEFAKRLDVERLSVLGIARKSLASSVTFLGAVAGAASIFNLLHSLAHFQIAALLGALVSTFRRMFHTPIDLVLNFVHFHLDPLAKDAIVAWLIFGTIVARATFEVIRPYLSGGQIYFRVRGRVHFFYGPELHGTPRAKMAQAARIVALAILFWAPPIILGPVSLAVILLVSIRARYAQSMIVIRVDGKNRYLFLLDAVVAHILVLLLLLTSFLVFNFATGA